MNLIGMSLPFRYLTGESLTVFDTIMGPVDTGLALIKSRGVQSVEIRAIGPRTDAQSVFLAASRLWDAGLEFTIHGDLPTYPAQSPFETAFPSLNLLTSKIKDRGQSMTIALHAYASQTIPNDELSAQTVTTLKTLTTLCQQQDLPYKFALELNRSKSGIDPSTTYQGVETMHDQINHPAIGICWDFGHGYSNFTNGLIERDPPVSFLKSVRHTHIHDLAENGKTHWPLTEQRLCLQTYVDLLKSVNYPGVWNLELDPPRYANEPNVKERILQSIDLLRQAVSE